MNEPDPRDLFAYEMTQARALESDMKMWQVPGLTLTAQAFLLTGSLSADFNTGASMLTAALGVFVSLASLQVMAKHRHLTEVNRAYLNYLEEWNGLGRIANLDLPPGALEPRGSRLASASSYRVWRTLLLAFAALNFFLVFAVWIWPDTF